MTKPTDKAVAAGRTLTDWLANRRRVETLTELREYLRIRSVGRYRIEEYQSVLIIRIPDAQVHVMYDIRALRPLGLTWLVVPLPCWQSRVRRRRVVPAPARHWAFS